jgi:hypothetical protein
MKEWPSSGTTDAKFHTINNQRNIAKMLDYLLSFYSWEQVMPVLGALVLGSLLVYHISSTKSSLPLINPQTRFDLTASKAKIRFVNDATSLLKAGYAKVIQFYYGNTVTR